jgi:hypothetical protein
MSPALIAEYQTRLPDKRLLEAKLHEFYELAQQQMERPALEDGRPRRRRMRKPPRKRKR